MSVGEYSRDKGIGLGLRISCQLVQMMDGELNVQEYIRTRKYFSLDLDLPKVSHHANITNVEKNNSIGFKALTKSFDGR